MTTVHVDPSIPSVAVGTTEHDIYYDFVVRASPETNGSVVWPDVAPDDATQEHMSEAGFWVERKTVKVGNGSDWADDASDPGIKVEGE